MTIHDTIEDEKLQHDTYRETAKVSAFSSGKIDKYEYRTGEEIYLLIKFKFTYSPSEKAIENTNKNN